MTSSNAINFDGSTQYGTVLGYSALTSLTAVTIEGWFSQHAATPDFRVAHAIATADGTGGFSEMQRDNSNQKGINFGVKYSGTSADGFGGSSGPFTTDTWVYVALAHDPAGDKKTHIYFGAQSVAELSPYGLQETAVGTEQVATGMNFYLGTDPGDAGSGTWSGNIGGFLRIWNVARNFEQLRQNYEKSLLSARETGLIGNFTFTEGTGTTVVNEYAAGNILTLTGSPSWVLGPDTIIPKGYDRPENALRYVTVGDGMSRSEGAT